VGNDAANPQIQIGVTMTANTGAGASQAVGDIERVKAAQVAATATTEALGEEEASVGAIQQEYGVSAEAAARALAILAQNGTQAAIGSAEMEAALEAAQAELAGISEAQAAYNAQVRASAEALVAQMTALEGVESAEAQVGTASQLVQAAMARLGVTETEVAIAARNMNTSFEATARAMIQIKQAELAAEVTRIRTEMEGTVVATEAQATGLAAVGEQFQQVSTQRQVLSSIRELARGGAYAIRGEAQASFLLGTALNSLLPGIGIIIAVASGVGLVAQLLEQHSEKAEEAADKVSQKQQEMEDKTNEFATTLKNVRTVCEQEYDGIAQAATRAAAAIEAVVTQEKAHQRIIDERADAELAAQLGNLDQQEVDAQRGQTPEAKAEIARKFDAQRLNLRQKRKQEKADEEAQAAREDLAGTQSKIKALTDEQATKDAEIQKQDDNLTQASIELYQRGILSDAERAQAQLANLQKKQFAGGLSPSEQELLEELQRTTPGLVASEATKGKQFTQAVGAKPLLDDSGKEIEGTAGLQSQLDEMLVQEKRALDRVSVDPNAGAAAAQYKARADQLQTEITLINNLQGQYAALAAAREKNAKAQENTTASRGKLNAKLQDQQIIVGQIQPLKLTTVAVTGEAVAESLEEKQQQERRERERKAKGEKEVPDYTDLFNTKLTPEEEAQFQIWKAKNAPQDSGSDYDLRGAFKEGVNPADDPSGRGHLPDTYKKPNHPTFSDQSIYSDHEHKGGTWGGTDDNTTFTPGPENLKMFSEDQLLAYFKKVEPKSSLILPDDVKKDKRAETQTYEQQMAADRAELDNAREALRQAEEANRKMSEAVKGFGETARRHADQTVRGAEIMHGALDAYKVRVDAAEEAIHKLEDAHRAAMNNYGTPQ